MDPVHIRDYHAHVYYTPATRPDAERLRADMETRFPEARFGRWRDRPVGPHPCAMFQVAFDAALFASLTPWLMVNRGPLTIFLHPQTGFPKRDHAQHAVWMGPQQTINLDALPEED